MKKTLVMVLAALCVAACQQEPRKMDSPPAPEAPPAAAEQAAPAAAHADTDVIGMLLKSELATGLDPEMAFVPEDNPVTPAKVELGRLLYFDARTSRDGTVSCATCHHPDTGWTDKGPTSTGIGGQKGTRRAPPSFNRLFSTLQFWDGRAASVEEQAKGPIENPIEHGMTHADLEARFSKIPEYGPLFEKAFGTSEVTIDRFAKAVASFERTIISGNSPFDKWQAGDESAVSEEAKRGHQVYLAEGRCAICHSGANFTNEQFHNLGVGMNKEKPDLGRYEVTKAEKDKGAFKTPTLRNLSSRAPYMHDGSEPTLESVVELYNRGGNKNDHLDPLITPLNLTEQQKSDLIAFMKSLDGPSTKVDIPDVFPGGWKAGMPVE
ncbi:MAG: c-type cytochrome [Chrysiogenetes bacterium]|nr:c-type cytochrome [Chrysiogenetes bacterium]